MTGLLIKMILIWIFVFVLGNILYKFLKNNKMFSKITQGIYNYRKKISIFLVGLIIVGVYVLLFSVRGSETVNLDVDIRNYGDTELHCEKVEEYYSKEYFEFGYINFEIRLKIKKIYDKEHKYSIRFCVERDNYPFSESLQKSYMNCTIGDLTKLKILLREAYDYEQKGYYYFDINLPKEWNKYIPENELYFRMYIYVGDDLLPLNRERITLKKTIRNIDFDEKTTITSYFGNDWNIVYDKEIKDSKAIPNIIESKRDVHQITTIVRESTNESVTQEIKLERNLALFYTKLGVFLGTLLAGISLIVSISLHEKRSLNQKIKKRENN